MEILKLKDLKGKKVHFIGIGGISMSALARMLKREKIHVQGSDESRNDEVLRLEKLGIEVKLGHSAENVKDADIVVYTSAISNDNPELMHAKEHNLQVLKRAELLGIIASDYRVVISVAGSHGKTTATAMIAEILLSAGLKPTIHLGGVLSSINSNVKIGNKNYFVTESCEYKDNFLFLRPDLSVILNVDADHLDYFGSLDGVKQSFKKFAKNTRDGGINLICIDDKNSKQLTKLENVATFGMKNADIVAENIKEYSPCLFSFDVIFEGFKLGNIKLNIFGKHNVYNALAAVFVGLMCGVDFCDIKSSIEKFSGTKRRTEFIGEFRGAKVYHDYAHHPKQIKEMIKVGRRLANASEGKLFAVFEPHTFSRTKYLLDDFANSFIGADQVMFAPVYSAREVESDGFSSDMLFKKTKELGINAKNFKSFEEIKDFLKTQVKEGDYVFVLGAGTIENLAKMLNK